jgi:hypothetical protein
MPTSQIKRPSKYDAHTAMMLGPTTPDPTIDLRGLTINLRILVSLFHQHIHSA